MLRA
ncbi:unnamed protein product [Cuscuta europaea]|jgi:hypothetical protein